MNLDAYTVRKLAPKLLIAVVAVNISIYLCVAAIDITNIVGRGLNQLISAPFMQAAESKFQLDTLQGADDTLIFFGITIAVGILLTLSLAGGQLLPMIGLIMIPIVLAVLAVLATLVIRKALLVVLTIVSPIAISLWVLPGTEKYFKQWWSLFLKTLMVYPIIAALFAVTNIMAVVTFDSGQLTREEVVAAGEIDPGQAGGAGGDGFGENALNAVIGVILVFIPLFMIPFAFKFAGGAIGAVSGQLADLQKPINRWAGRSRQDKLNTNVARARAGNLMRGNNRFTRRVNKGFGVAMNADAALSGAKEGLRHNKNDGLNRLQRIKERAAAAVALKQNEARMGVEQKLGESYSGKMSEGNDDIAAAKLVHDKGKHASMDEARAAELIKQDPSKYNTHTAEGQQNIASVLRMINEEERIYGREAMQEKAGMDYFSSPTFLKGGKDEMAGVRLAQKATELATDSTTGKVDAAKETQLLNKFRKAAEKRLDASGASFTAHSIAQQALRTNKLLDEKGDYNEEADKAFEDRAREQGLTKQEALERLMNERLLDSAMSKTSAGQRGQSHDRAVETFVEHQQDKIADLASSERFGFNVRNDEGKVDLGLIDWGSSKGRELLEDKDFQLQMADMKNMREGLRYNPQISAEKSEELLRSVMRPMNALETGYLTPEDRQNRRNKLNNESYQAVRESFRAEAEDERSHFG